MNKCIDCGIEVSRKSAKRCLDCYEKYRKKIYTKNDSNTTESNIITNLKNYLGSLQSYSYEKKFSAKGDTLVIHLSDLHAGKVVKDQEERIIYDENIFVSRMDKLCKQLLRLLDTHISKSVDVSEVVIISTGDQANGENIYETQAYEQELAPPKQVMLVVDIIRKLVLSLLERKLKVRFYGVKGNHGRTGKETNPTANWDIMIYMILDFWAKCVLKNPNFQVKYAETDYITFNIRKFRYLARHIAPEQPDTPSGRVKFNEWARTYKADGIVYGHWHHFGVFDVDGIRVFRGGSTVGADSLAESMAKYSEPIQLIWGVNDNRVSSFIYAVDLGKE